MALPVSAVNDLTARWAAALTDASTVLSAVGVWPLLALLRRGADEDAGQELDRALGSGPADAAELLRALHEAEAVRAALGLWSAAGLPLERDWLDAVPAGAHGELTGREVLDAWARKHTGGLIERMPVESLAQIRLLLASAIAVTTRWEQPFTDGTWQIESGPWAGRRIAGLARSGRDLDQVAVAETGAGPLTVVRCRGRTDVDVDLVLGPPDAAAGGVLAAAVTARGMPGSRLSDGTPGPGLQVGERASIEAPTLHVHTPRFRVTGAHDLLRSADLFGLRTAADPSTNHFPGISTEALFVSSARQNAVAIFSAEGFEAAAVTAVGMRATSMRQPSGRTYRHIAVTIDRPFGFLARHRPTGLVLVAGWVANP